MSLQSKILRIAAELPKGDPTRRKILGAVHKNARVDGSVFPRNSYLNRFFNEKGLPAKVFDITDSHGVAHLIPNEVVLEYMAQSRGSELKQIEDTIRKIDFANGDVNHFLEHLAKAIAELYSGALRFASDKEAGSGAGRHIQSAIKDLGAALKTLRNPSDP